MPAAENVGFFSIKKLQAFKSPAVGALSLPPITIIPKTGTLTTGTMKEVAMWPR